MNKKLEELYKSKWNDLLENVSGTKAAHPLLIKVKDEYKDADIKVMIVGQETDGWHGLFEENKKDVNALMDDYYNYFYNIVISGTSLAKRLKNKSKRPFWNRKNFKYFEEELPKIYNGKKVAFVWNNISKIGKCTRGKPTEKIQKLEKKYFDQVFEKELEILEPNIVIFVTGNRPISISHEQLKPIKLKQVSEVNFTGQFSNIIAFRTYHPNARIEGGKKHLKKDIIELIKTRI